MGKYADMLLNDTEEVPVKKQSYASMLLDDEEPQEEYTPTGAIDTRTSKPVMQWTPDETKQADFGALFKSGWVDKPESKIQIFAASRFPDLPKAEREARYKMQDGKVSFKGDDGKYHFEVHGDFLSKLRGGAGESIAALPSGVLGAVGATGGLGGAALGAAGGEAIRKVVGNLVFDEKQSSVGNLIDITKEAAMGLAGETVGRVLVGAKNNSLLRSGGDLKNVVKNDIRRNIIKPEDHAKAEFIKTLADQHGVELAPHQLYNKQSMTDIWKYLRRHPQTSDAIQTFETKVADQLEGAVGKFSDNLAMQKDAGVLGAEIRDTAQSVLSRAHQTRTKAVSPLYKKAFENTPDVDISAPLAEIDGLLGKAPEGSSAQTVLNKVKGLFVDQDGAPVTNLEKIDWAKKEVDAYLKNIMDPNISSTSKETLRTIQEIKKKVLAAVDEQAPEYATARKVYEKLTPRVKQLEDSVIGRLANIKDDRGLVKATEGLFDTNMSAKFVREARASIQAENPQLWDQILSSHVRGTYNTLKETQNANVVNAAGKMHQKLFGTIDARDKMKAAMAPEQYKNFEGLMTVFERAAKGHGAESMTAQNLIINEQMSKNVGSTAARLATSPLKTIREGIFDKWNDIVLAGKQEAVLAAMLDSQATRQIAKMRTLTPGSEKQIRSLSVFTSWLSERAFQADLHKTQGPEGQLPR